MFKHFAFFGYLKDPMYSEEITQAATRGYAFAQAVEASRRYGIGVNAYKVGCTRDFEENVDEIITNERFARDEDRPIIFMIGKVLNQRPTFDYSNQSYVKACAN